MNCQGNACPSYLRCPSRFLSRRLFAFSFRSRLARARDRPSAAAGLRFTACSNHQHVCLCEESHTVDGFRKSNSVSVRKPNVQAHKKQRGANLGRQYPPWFSCHEGFKSAEQIMMAKVSTKVQEPEKVVKKKSWKARLKKDAHNPPPEYDKVKRKSAANGVRSALDRIRHWGPQKERDVAQQINKQSDRNPSQAAPIPVFEVTKREQAQVAQRKLTRSPALERMKKPEVKILRRPPYSSGTLSTRNTVPSQPTLRSIGIPLPLPNGANQASIRTRSRAQALLVEMVQQSRINSPGAQQHGLSALATELPVKQKIAEGAEAVVTADNVPEGEVEGVNYRKADVAQTVFGTGGVGESNYSQGDYVTEIVITEVSEFTEPRFITPKEVSLFEDWRPGSQKLDKPPSVDTNHWLRVEMEKQQELRLAQKEATRKKEMRHFRRFDGAGLDDTNITPLSIYSSQSIANTTIREDVEEESARGYAKFLYRPGAAWRNLGTDSASSLLSFERPESLESRPKSCESRKSTTEIVFAISSASARREAMRKQLAERLREDLLRKKLLVSQNRAAARHSQCTCC